MLLNKFTTSEDIAFFMISIIVCAIVFIAFLLGISYGSCLTIEEIRKEAIEMKVAQYNLKTGNFEWRSCSE